MYQQQLASLKDAFKDMTAEREVRVGAQGDAMVQRRHWGSGGEKQGGRDAPKWHSTCCPLSICP